jgi:hypothetical protein
MTSKNEFSKCCKKSLNKKQGLKCVLKYSTRTNKPLKRGFKRLFGFYAAL